MNKDTKGSHSDTGGNSLLRELKKEIIKLKSLNRRAAEEIRDLDDMIIKSIEDNKVIEYPEEDKAYFAGFSSINLLNRLDGITNGGYVESYDDLKLEMKTLDGWYQAEHPDFYHTEYLNEDKHTCANYHVYHRMGKKQRHSWLDTLRHYWRSRLHSWRDRLYFWLDTLGVADWRSQDTSKKIKEPIEFIRRVEEDTSPLPPAWKEIQALAENIEEEGND